MRILPLIFMGMAVMVAGAFTGILGIVLASAFLWVMSAWLMCGGMALILVACVYGLTAKGARV